MPPADLVRRLSDELARDPGSDVFLPLAELLTAQGQTGAALRVARGGAARRPDSAAAHALVATVAAAAGELGEADAAWGRVAACAPDAATRARAHEGRAYVAFRQQRLADAAAHLDAAVDAGAEPARIAAARARLGSPLPGPAASPTEPPAPAVAPAVAAALAAVGDQATRAMAHLALGPWRRIVVEAEEARVGMAPGPEGVVLVATSASAPPGQLARLLARAAPEPSLAGDGR